MMTKEQVRPSKRNASGYSGRALVDKLGVLAGDRIKTRGVPANYLELVAPLPERILLSSRLRGNVDIWHMFTRSRAELTRVLPKARHEIKQNGMIWVSWPKKASGVASTVTEDTVREVAFPLGLVDVKVCAVDATWSALKLVIRKSLRQSI